MSKGNKGTRNLRGIRDFVESEDDWPWMSHVTSLTLAAVNTFSCLTGKINAWKFYKI